MRQRAPPIAPQVGAVLPEWIPGRPHAHLAGKECTGNRLTISTYVVGCPIHDTAEARPRANAAAGIDDNIRLQPVFLVLPHPHVTQRHLAVGDVVEGISDGAEMTAPIPTGTPCPRTSHFQRDVEVKKNQRVFV